MAPGLAAFGGPITFVEGAEAEKTDANMRLAHERPWQLWKREAMLK